MLSLGGGSNRSAVEFCGNGFSTRLECRLFGTLRKKRESGGGGRNSSSSNSSTSGNSVGNIVGSNKLYR